MFIHPSDCLKSAKRRTFTRSGAVVAEFALIVPFLVVCLNGMAELGQAMLVRQTLNDAARKGCRTGILPNRASSDIINDVNNILSDNNMPTTGSSATVTILVNGQPLDASTAGRGDQISVKVSIPFSSVAWTMPIFLSGNSVESETLVMLRQG
jgi:Flp pilus assembly protein TadG